ncbi:MAG: hypothetical protein BWK80_19420 [Desulfobacteraceae bacterium IS3]|nr:MAG: hypothetical protein BWK80_19420 [Desulfobacteraceae bacterium IS3]
MNGKRIFQHPGYRKIIEEDFTPGNYDRALPRFQSLYETLKSELSAADKAILLSRIANCASDALLKQNIEDRSLVQTFWNYLEEYLKAAPEALKDDRQFGGSTDEPKKRLSEALELLIRYEPECLKEKAVDRTSSCFARIDYPGWGFDLSLDVLMQKINEERIRFTRKGHIANTKALAEAYIEVSEPVNEHYRYARATVMNILSDLVWFEGGKDSEKKSLEWLNRCLEINPDDLFAKTRKRYIEERQTVQEQIRRFKHDTGNTKAGIEAMLTLCLRLPQAAEEPLHTYLKTVQTEVKHLYGVHRFVHNEQCRIEDTDPEELINDLIAPHNSRNANFFIMTASGTGKKWKTDPDYLRLALYNLIKNSLEAFQRRRIPLAERNIRISVLPDSHTLIIEDNAGGIEPALKDHIFSPYVSSKGIRKGTGLGLSNARRAVEIMGGTLEFPENQPENGARFEIRMRET